MKWKSRCGWRRLYIRPRITDHYAGKGFCADIILGRPSSDGPMWKKTPSSRRPFIAPYTRALPWKQSVCAVVIRVAIVVGDRRGIHCNCLKRAIRPSWCPYSTVLDKYAGAFIFVVARQIVAGNEQTRKQHVSTYTHFVRTIFHFQFSCRTLAILLKLTLSVQY